MQLAGHLPIVFLSKQNVECSVLWFSREGERQNMNHSIFCAASELKFRIFHVHPPSCERETNVSKNKKKGKWEIKSPAAVFVNRVRVPVAQDPLLCTHWLSGGGGGGGHKGRSGGSVSQRIWTTTNLDPCMIHFT